MVATPVHIAMQYKQGGHSSYRFVDISGNLAMPGFSCQN